MFWCMCFYSFGLVFFGGFVFYSVVGMLIQCEIVDIVLNRFVEDLFDEFCVEIVQLFFDVFVWDFNKVEVLDVVVMVVWFIYNVICKV